MSDDDETWVRFLNQAIANFEKTCALCVSMRFFDLFEELK